MITKTRDMFLNNQDTNNIQEILKLCTQGKFRSKEEPIDKERVVFQNVVTRYHKRCFER
jgi:hypothetical protein